MPPNYNLGAVILAVLAVINPLTLVLVRWFLSRSMPIFGFGMCHVLCWDDLPGNRIKLHEHNGFSGGYDMTGALAIETQLNYAGRRLRRNAAKIPPDLRLSTTKYLKTDVRTLFCVLMTAAQVESRHPRYGERWFEFGGVTITFKGEIWTDDFLIGTVKLDGYRNGHTGYTKMEVEQIMSGAAPSFREEIPIYGARVFRPDPRAIGAANYRRGGWVFAAGLLRDLQREPFASIYPRPAPPKVLPWEGCRYAYDVVTRRFIPAFSQHTGLDADLLNLLEVASTALDYMIRDQSGSGVQSCLADTPLSSCHYPGTEYTRSLTVDECTLCINLFNSKEPLESGEIEFLRMSMLPVLGLIVKGVHSTFQHQNNESEQLFSRVVELFSENKDVYVAY